MARPLLTPATPLNNTAEATMLLRRIVIVEKQWYELVTELQRSHSMRPFELDLLSCAA